MEGLDQVNDESQTQPPETRTGQASLPSVPFPGSIILETLSTPPAHAARVFFCGIPAVRGLASGSLAANCSSLRLALTVIENHNTRAGEGQEKSTTFVKHL